MCLRLYEVAVRIRNKSGYYSEGETMSYEELLAMFTRPEAKISNRALALALYAVVELPQPAPGWGKELEFPCSECSRSELVLDPCPTIREIEKVFALPGMR